MASDSTDRPSKDSPAPPVLLADGREPQNTAELREFLNRLGMVMRLAKKERKASTAPRWRLPSFSIPAKRLIPLVALGAIAVVIVGWSQRSTGTGAVPNELQGVWETSAAKYAHRSFRITADSVAFQIAQGEQQVSPISGVNSRQVADTTQYAIDYVSAGSTSTLRFSYISGSVPMIRLVNQPTITWQKRH